MTGHNMNIALAPIFTSYKYLLNKSPFIGSDSSIDFWLGKAREEVNKSNFKCDWNKLTYRELMNLGFRPYTDKLMLPSIGHLLVTAKGTKFKTIGGTDIIYDGTNITDDVRSNMLGYGIEVDIDEYKVYMPIDLARSLAEGTLEKVCFHEAFYTDTYFTYNKRTKAIELHTSSNIDTTDCAIFIKYNHIIDRCIATSIDNVRDKYTTLRVRMIKHIEE